MTANADAARSLRRTARILSAWVQAASFLEFPADLHVLQVAMQREAARLSREADELEGKMPAAGKEAA